MSNEGLEAGELWRTGRDRLTSLYEPGEAEVIMDWLLEEFAGIRKTERIIEGTSRVTLDHSKKISEALIELEKGRPVQYILGKAWFFGMEFHVDESVLIPRPETEELVDLVLKDTDPGFEGRVLDIGTGSGCIAVALAKNRPRSKVSALDIDEGSLKVAKKNAEVHGVDIHFFVRDIFNKDTSPLEEFDIIVSNPPYVRVSEKRQMRSNVLDYEPEKALFVDDDDPLTYYREIMRMASQSLSRGGRVYLEINEAMGEELVLLLSGWHPSRVDILKDLKQKDRFLIFSL